MTDQQDEKRSMAEDERVVLLGTVQERQSVDNSSPFACKAGGSPAWYNSSEPPQEAESLVCPKCSKPLFLVSQVYAPVDTDRTLYVFGCNSVDCTETPGSWRVLRDQNEAAELAAAAAVAGPASFAPQSSNVVKNAWDAAGSDSDSSDWGENDDDDNDPFASTSGGGSDGIIDLEALLMQRDDAMSAATNTSASSSNKKQSKAATSGNSTATAAAASKPASATKAASLAFPALPIEVIDEPYEDYTAENDFSHENALLEDYMKQEEEEKSADVGDLRKIISSTKKSKNGSAASAGTGSSSGESYEKTPARQRHFMRFQKRISRCPLQCLRYDYGGEPLWPVPKPQSVKVPKCVCGEARVFELQLTPTINYFLKVDQFASPVTVPKAVPLAPAESVGDSESAKKNGSKVAAAAAAAVPPPVKSAAGGGMDWMSVMVYCCPKSCSRSREEFVFVLPAEKA